MRESIKNTKNERGGAGVKLTIVLVILFLIGNAAYNYIPIAYEGESLKQDMQTAVVQGMATTNGVTMVDTVKAKLQRALHDNNIPTDAIVEVKPVTTTVQARVRYSKRVNMLPFGLFVYNYTFDHTATPTGFLIKSN